MYFDSKRNRILLKSGYSLVDEDRLMKAILEGDTQGFIVESSISTESYELKYGEKISFKEDVDLLEDNLPKDDHQHSEEELERLIALIHDSERYVQSEVNDERIELELEFIERVNAVTLFLSIYDILQDAKAKGYVWGVGRGSSVASYLLYLLEVHDVDPIKFEIPFEEFSKE